MNSKMVFSKKGCQLARGYFEVVQLVAGRLTVSGWMFLPDRKFDEISIFISGKYAGTTECLPRDDVAKVFPFIPHARYSGFYFSLPENEEEIDNLIDICLIGVVNGSRVAKMETCYPKKLSKDISDPPVNLMKRVANTESPSFFKSSGFQSYCNYWSLICKYCDPKQIKTMLDWGCGCGRLINLLASLTGIPEIYGCDIDPESIEWCKKNISNAQFSVIPLEPPTEYADNFFDLVIGNSVFTHLKKGGQRAWLGEMKRIVAPGGFSLASVHGEFATYFSFPDSVNNILKKGIYDEIQDSNLDGIAPKGYYRGIFNLKNIPGNYLENILKL